MTWTAASIEKFKGELGRIAGELPLDLRVWAEEGYTGPAEWTVIFAGELAARRVEYKYRNGNTTFGETKNGIEGWYVTVRPSWGCK